MTFSLQTLKSDLKKLKDTSSFSFGVNSIFIPRRSRSKGIKNLPHELKIKTKQIKNRQNLSKMCFYKLKIIYDFLKELDHNTFYNNISFEMFNSYYHIIHNTELQRGISIMNLLRELLEDEFCFEYLMHLNRGIFRNAINELGLSREQILNNLNNDNRRRILYLLLLQIQRQRNRSFNFGMVPPPPPPGQLIPPRAYVPSKSGKISKKNIRKLRPKCQQYIREIKDIYFQNMDKLIELRNTVDYTNYTLFKRIFNLLPNDYNISPLRRSLHNLARLFIMNNCEYSDDNYRHFRNNLDYRNINHLNKVLHDIYIYYTITDSVYTTAISNLNLNLN